MSSTESRLPEIREHPTPTRSGPIITTAISTTMASSSSNDITIISTNNTTTVLSLGVLTPSTPRIDISRASSSSHHEDSRDSSPENVFEQVGTGTLQETSGVGGLGGFREDGTMDLRSSTEELYFMEPDTSKRKSIDQDQFTQLPQQHQHQQPQSAQQVNIKKILKFKNYYFKSEKI